MPPRFARDACAVAAPLFAVDRDLYSAGRAGVRPGLAGAFEEIVRAGAGVLDRGVRAQAHSVVVGDAATDVTRVGVAGGVGVDALGVGAHAEDVHRPLAAEATLDVLVLGVVAVLERLYLLLDVLRGFVPPAVVQP